VKGGNLRPSEMPRKKRNRWRGCGRRVTNAFGERLGEQLPNAEKNIKKDKSGKLLHIVDWGNRVHRFTRKRWKIKKECKDHLGGKEWRQEWRSRGLYGPPFWGKEIRLKGLDTKKK